MSNDGTLTTSRAAAIAGTSRETVRRAAKDGHINATTKLDGVTGPYLFTADEVYRWIETRTRTTGKERNENA